MEGDVRMVEETTAGPWVSGRLEVFFEGSWSQVCALGFDGVDADVACRQLGYGAGTANSAQARSFRSSDERVQAEAAVFAEVGLTLVGCTGTETSILQCPGDDVLEGFRSRGCNDVALFGLFLSCVANPIEGMRAPSQWDQHACNCVCQFYHASRTDCNSIVHVRVRIRFLRLQFPLILRPRECIC